MVEMANLSTWVWVVVGGVIAYVFAVDDNAYIWLDLQFKRVQLFRQYLWFRIRHNPDSPWVRWEIDRRANKIAEQLIKERDKPDD